ATALLTKDLPPSIHPAGMLYTRTQPSGPNRLRQGDSPCGRMWAIAVPEGICQHVGTALAYRRWEYREGPGRAAAPSDVVPLGRPGRGAVERPALAPPHHGRPDDARARLPQAGVRRAQARPRER